MSDNQRCESSGCIQVDRYLDYIRVHSTISSTTMQCTLAEFRAHIAKVKAGDYDHIGAESAVQA